MFRLCRRRELPLLASRRLSEVPLTPPAYHLLRSKERIIEYSHEEVQLPGPEYQNFGCGDLVGGRRHYSRPSNYTGDFHEQFLNVYRSNSFSIAFELVAEKEKFDFEQVFHSLVGRREETDEFVFNTYLAVSLLEDIIKHGQHKRVSEISMAIVLVAATHVVDEMKDVEPCIAVLEACQQLAELPSTQTLQFLKYKALRTIKNYASLEKVEDDIEELEQEISKLELGPTFKKVFTGLQNMIPVGKKKSLNEIKVEDNE